jgi:protein gp37
LEKTKIDWCDSSWNPVTGCFHGCEYCYAKSIAHRFGCASAINPYPEVPGELLWFTGPEGKIHELDEPIYDSDREHKAPYPYGFDPTFHKYRLDEYAKKEGRNIFVCSMADLFGAWVPDDWKIEVLEACYKAPQHNYLFLTKDPIGYSIWNTEKHPAFKHWETYTENMWLGVTYTGRERLEGHYRKRDIGEPYSIWTNFWYLHRMDANLLPTKAHKFISIEPLSCDICEVEDERDGGKLLENFLIARDGCRKTFEWVIVGAETGNKKDKVIPDKTWVEKLVDLCRRAEIPIFMKSSLEKIWGEPLIREFPKELEK